MTIQKKNLITASLFGVLLVAVTVKLYHKDRNFDLTHVDRISGTVVKRGVTDKNSGGGDKLKVKGFVFFFKLHNSSQTFATYKPKQDYSTLIEKIKTGDTITIYYKEGKDHHLNLDVYQIEEKGQIIQSYQSYNNTNKKLSWLTGVMGFGLLTFGIWQYLKRRHRAAT